MKKNGMKRFLISLLTITVISLLTVGGFLLHASADEAEFANAVASVTKGGITSYYEDFNSAVTVWKNGGTLKLLKNASYSGILNIRPMYGFTASDYVLDLNGKTLNLESIQVGKNGSPNALRVGPTLTLEDSGEGGTVNITGCNMIDYGGLMVLRGGTITGGNGTWGACFLLHIYGSLDMYDGVTLTRSTSNNFAGGVFVGSDSEFNMYGGLITGNSATNYGGGVVLSDNDGAVFNLYGGTISGNTAAKGNGVAVLTGSFNIKGNAILTDGVYLASNKKINIGTTLSETPIGVTLQNGTGAFTSGWSTYMTDGEGKVADPADYFVSDDGYEIVLIGNEVNVHQHNYGNLIEQVDSTCEADGLKAHYYCAGCGQYLDENQAKVSYDELVIEGGHTFVRRNKVEPTCTEYGKREHFYCTTCEKYFNTNKQQVNEWSLSIGTLGHDYDFDNAVFTWTPDDSAYYKWTATVSYSCKRCGEQVEKSAGIEGKSATWNQDNGIRAYVYYNSKYYYSEPIYRESDIGTATMNSWTPWEYDDRLPDTKPEDANSKGWYLTKDVTLTDTWTVPKTNYPYLTLCLNGHVITGNFDTPKSVIYVPKGVEFELCEYNFDETHYYYIGKTVTDSHGNELNFVGQIASGEDDPNYIAAARKGSFKGGYITGGTGRVIGGNTYGGAVYIDGDTGTKYYNCGEFKSTGVTFFGNYADYGGAVYVASNAYFDFSSGNIIGNQAGNEGGGVYANKRAYSDSQYGNYGMQSSSGQIIHNTAGQGGNGYGGGIAGWSYLPYGSIVVRGNAAVGENAKGGGVYGFLKIMDPYIYENYTTGLGPGVYVTNYNFTVDNSTSHIRAYSNQYASSVTVNEIELTSRRGDLYFASGYILQLIGTTYPPSITDGVRVYVEMASGTGNFATNWKSSSSYKVYEFFAANPGYKIVENGSTLSLQSSNGDYYVNTAQSFVAYTTYYYANGTPASYNTDETHRYVFSGTQSVSTTFGISGYLKGDNSIYLRFDNLKLTASGTNSLFQFYPYYGNLDVYIELVGDSVLTTNGKSAIYGGRADMSLNIQFTGSGTLTVVDTVAGTANNLFGPYDNRDVHIYLGGEDIVVYELVKEKIANIGFVTYSQEIKERITAARNGYDNLDDELKAKVTNYPDLLAAEAAYELAAAAEINLTATGYTGDYDGEAHGATITVISPEGTTVKYGTKSGEYTLDESPTFTDAGTYKIYYQVTKEKCNTVSDYVTVKINKINATVTIVGNNSTVDYDSTEHTVTGYVATADTTVYDVTKDFTFSGNATASQTNAGTANMGLTAEQFANNNANFETVTFVVTDGYQTINKINATVTIVGNNSTVDYDSTEHTVTGYVATADTTVYDVTKDFTFSGNATASQTNAGTANMGLTAEQFANNNANFETVTFVVTDGYQTVNKINATVTIVGNNSTVDYDSTEYTVTDYVATVDTNLYDVTKDFDFSGDATAKRTNAGTTAMGLTAEQFANNNANFETVTFIVTDGYITIEPIDAKVMIIGKHEFVSYDGNSHVVSGYVAISYNELYNPDSDLTFSGVAEIEITNAGTEFMGLSAEQFVNNNANFATVTINVIDGYVTIKPIDVVVTIVGNNDTVDYNGTEQTVTGYTATADSDLYDVTKDFTFSGTAEATQTNAGTSYMGLTAEQFVNNNANFANVTFNVTDGYITVEPIDVVVTIVGTNDTVDYNGAEHTVNGYTATADSDLYDVTNDFTFNGTATASQTNAGTSYMELTAEQFANNNANFANVTFNVTDGYQTVNKINATVTIVGNNDTVDYNGAEHTVSGYTATADSDLYDVTKDFTFNGTAEATQTNAGTSNMGLTAEQFVNNNANFANVTFNVTDGYITVEPIDVVVTIVGNNDTVDYNGAEHTVNGYTATADSELYDVTKDFTFNGTATASQTNAGTSYMGLTAEQFVNNNANFATVTFIVTDGYQTVNKINATVTIVGNNDTVDYNGAEHTVNGYTATADSDLYDVTKDFTFNGTATASQTNAGTSNMGLTAEQFVNNNANFANVTFNVTDGYITVEKVDAVITAAPVINDLIYNGYEQELISAGVVDGGTLYYAIGTDANHAPGNGSYTTAIPSATESGVYYVWYKIEGDDNHNSIDPICIKAVIAEGDWVTLIGTLYQSDGKTPLVGAYITLAKGNLAVDSVITDGNGVYRFTVPTGVYNIIAEYEQTTKTTLIAIFENTEEDLVMIGGKTESFVDVNTDDGENLDVAVGGLDKEAQYIRESENVPEDKNVSVTMTVEPKSEETALNADLIIETADKQNLEFFEIKVEKTIDSVKTLLDETTNVLEIAIPYAKTNKRGLIVYSYHGDRVVAFTESESRENGTFRVDKENGFVYIYSNSFSTYAIGYTPYYRVDASLSFGLYNGTVTATLQGNGETFKLENVSMSSIVFEDIPKGDYILTITWEDGVANTLTMPMTVGNTYVASTPIDDKAGEDAEDSDSLLDSETSSPLDATVNLGVVSYVDTMADAGKYDEFVVNYALIPTKQQNTEETAVEPRRRDVFLI